jgi:sterol 3beta-glucosyltransferase
VALKKHGHRVRVAAFENYAGFVEEHGLEFHPIHGDVSQVAVGDLAQGARSADNPLKVLLSFNRLRSLVFDLQKDLVNACDGAQAIVYHPGAAIGYYLAQRANIPSILATPFPMTPTRDYPALIFYGGIRPGRPFNRQTHKIFEQLMWSATASAVKQFWKQAFGELPANFGCPYSRQNTRRLPTIVSCSRHVFPTPPDWPEHVHTTGYWFFEDEAGWQPPADLQAFLASGAPPVYVGFGSLGDLGEAERTTQLVVEAVRLAGQRAVLATGWQGMTRLEGLPESVFMLESVPHTWLFPQMAAVVHHGGAGTTAAGLRAGVPSVIIPFSNDQFAWGRRVYELGVGPKPIPRKALTAEKLADAIREALTEECRVASSELGGKIRTEQGIEAAARVIEDCLNAWDLKA